MLGQHGRGLTKALLTRPALAMARVGITPNMLTVVGTVLSVGVAVATLPQGRFIMGPPLLGVVLIGDSFDGILARATGRSSVFGAFLDSTLDRLADGAIFASLAAWAALSMKTDSAFLHVATVCLAQIHRCDRLGRDRRAHRPSGGRPGGDLRGRARSAPVGALRGSRLCSAGVLHHRRPAHCRG